jgi:aqualysin 1
MRHINMLNICMILVSLASCSTAANANDDNSSANRKDGKIAVIVRLHENSIKQTMNYNPSDKRFLHDENSDWSYVSQKLAGNIQSLEQKHGFKVKHAFNKVMRGFSARLTPEQIEALSKDIGVESISADTKMHAQAQNIPWGITKVNAHLSSSLAGNKSGMSTGANVYVLDTGSAKTHPDAVISGYQSFITGSTSGVYDCHGHGTHVAGTVGALDNSSYVVGVAPGIPTTAIKVLDCNGSGDTSDIVKAIDWVATNGKRPSIINMSLGGDLDPALDLSIENAVKAGVLIVVAAGNDGKDACGYSPANMGKLDGVITVGATDSSNNEAYFSNYGTCVDIWAPGVSVVSLNYTGGTSTKSGTSMASPHTAGVASLYMAKYPAKSPAEAEAAIKLDATVTTKLSKDGIRLVKLANAKLY